MKAELFAVFEDVYDLWVSSLKLQSDSFARVRTGEGFWDSGLIFVLAAFSRGLSDAGILMINRASGSQFLRGLVGNSLALGMAALLWAGCIWLAFLWPIGLVVPYRDVLGLVLVSYAPMVFGVFSIVPHAGLLWDGLLRVWMLLITIAGLNLHHRVPLLQAVAASGVGWLFFHLLGELFGSRVEKLRLRLLGRDHWVRPSDAVHQLLARKMAGR